MSVTFEKTSYLQTLNKSESLSSEDDIVKSPENGLQFKYGSADYEKFSKTYSNKGWKYRKVIALPAAVWSASIQVVYHLAKAIFIGIPKAPSDGRLYLKVQIFHILRDFQESWGRLTSLFHDKYGSFHVQESRCQRTCYESFLAKSALGPGKKPRETGEKTKKEQEADPGIPVADLKEKGEAESMSEKVPVVEKTKEVVQVSPSESRKIDQMSQKEIYEKFSCFPNDNEKRQKFAEIEAEEVHRVLYRGIIEPRSYEGAYILGLLSEKHLKGLAISRLSSEVIEKLFASDRNHEKNRERFAIIEASEVHKALYEGKIKSESILKLFSDDLLEGLEISRLSDGALERLFPYYGNYKVNLKRFAKIKASEVHKTLYEGKIKLGSAEGAYVLELLSDDHLEGLEISRLPDGALEKLFPCYGYDNRDVSLQRFAIIEASEVHKALYEGKINPESYGGKYILGLLSEKHLDGLKISQLSSKVLEELFTPHFTREAAANRFAIIEASEVQDALAKNLLDDYQIRLISIEQLKLLDFSRISNAVIDVLFPLWSVDDLRKKYSYWERSDKEVGGKAVEQLPKKECELPESSLPRLSCEQQQKNNALLSQLLESQRNILEPRLYKKKPFSKGSFGGGAFTRFLQVFWEDDFEKLSKAFSSFDKSFEERFAVKSDELVQKAYRDLDVESDVSDKDLINAYKKLALHYHSCINSEKGAEEKFQEVSEAIYIIATDREEKANKLN